MTRFPALQLLLQGYLHADWLDEFPDSWSAVAEFLKSEQNSVGSLLTEIESVLAEKSDQRSVRKLFIEDMGSGYNPEAEGWTVEAWLAELLLRARASM